MVEKIDWLLVRLFEFGLLGGDWKDRLIIVISYEFGLLCGWKDRPMLVRLFECEFEFIVILNYEEMFWWTFWKL